MLFLTCHNNEDISYIAACPAVVLVADADLTVVDEIVAPDTAAMLQCVHVNVGLPQGVRDHSTTLWGRLS